MPAPCVMIRPEDDVQSPLFCRHPFGAGLDHQGHLVLPLCAQHDEHLDFLRARHVPEELYLHLQYKRECLQDELVSILLLLFQAISEGIEVVVRAAVK